MDWQPIETAPRDGTRVIVTPGDAMDATIGWYEGRKGVSFTSRGPIEFSGWVSLEQWCGMEYGDCISEHLDIWPTHWMPLPEPPDTP